MLTILVVFHVIMAISLVVLVLLQRGPGATMGAAFGAGASGTVFGSRGAANFLTRATGVLAFGFFAISLSMAVLAARSGGIVDQDDLGVVGAPIEEPVAPDEMDPPAADEGEFPGIPEEDGAGAVEEEPEGFPDIPEDDNDTDGEPEPLQGPDS